MDTENDTNDQRRTIIKKGDELVYKSEYEMALECYKQVYQLEDEEINYKLGRLYSMMGEKEEGKKLLEQAIKVDVKGHYYRKYFEYAQLVSNPLVAVESYNQGLAIVKALHQSCIDIHKASKYQQDLIEVHCALAEVFQTDLIAYPQSEAVCLNHIQQALALDPQSLEALEQQANFYLNKEDSEQLSISLGQLHQSAQCLEATQQLNHPEQLINIAKLFLEDSQYSLAIHYLQLAEALQPQHLECLYLLAFASFKAKQYFTVQDILHEVQQKDSAVFQDHQELYDAFQDLYKEFNALGPLSDHQQPEDEQMQDENEEDWEEI